MNNLKKYFLLVLLGAFALPTTYLLCSKNLIKTKVFKGGFSIDCYLIDNKIDDNSSFIKKLQAELKDVYVNACSRLSPEETTEKSKDEIEFTQNIRKLFYETQWKKRTRKAESIKWKNYYYYVLRDSGKPCAFVEFTSNVEKGFMHIFTFAIDSSSCIEMANFGENLINSILEEFVTIQGIKVIPLKNSSNFYETLGFKKKGVHLIFTKEDHSKRKRHPFTPLYNLLTPLGNFIPKKILS